MNRTLSLMQLCDCIGHLDIIQFQILQFKLEGKAKTIYCNVYTENQNYILECIKLT